MTKRSTLLEQIEQAALDDNADITGALRKCVALGGQSGSEELRTWATRELKGYDASDQIPEYRTVGAPIALDGATFNAHITGQQISPGALPSPMRDHIKEEIDLRMPLAEIIESVKTASGNVVRMSLPGGADIARLMNYETKQSDPYLVQQITRLYWEVHVSSLLRIVDVVRTTLVELVAEIRAGTPQDAEPTKAVTDQAVNVAIYGDKNRIRLTDLSQLHADGDVKTEARERETTGRRLMWWLVGIATVVAAVVAIIALVVTG
jgi:hypothetical protein